MSSPRRGSRLFIHKAVIDLIDEKRRTLLTRERRELRNLLRRHHCSRGIGRRCDHGDARLRAPVAARDLRVHLVAALRSDGNEPRHSAQRVHEMAVARIARIGEEHFVLGIEEDAQREQQRRARARGHDDATCGNFDVVAVVVELGDRFAQLGKAQRRRVEHRLRFQRALRRLDDGPRRGEVRLADLEVDHVAPLRLDLASEGLDFHHLEGLDMSHSCRESNLIGEVVHFAILCDCSSREAPRRQSSASRGRRCEAPAQRARCAAPR